MAFIQFGDLAIGGRGKIDFVLAGVAGDVATLNIISRETVDDPGEQVGTAEVDLAENTGTVEFTTPLVAVNIDCTGQKHALGDIVRPHVDGDFMIVFVLSPDGYQFCEHPGADYATESQRFRVGADYRRVGHVDLAGIDTTE